MAITIANSDYFSGQGPNPSKSFTVSTGDDRFLLVLIACRNDVTITSVTYGAANLSLEVNNDGNSRETQVYYLANPAAGTDTLTVNAGSHTDYYCITVFELNGVYQADGIRGTGTSTGYDTTPHTQIDSAVGDLVFDVVAYLSSGTPTFTVDAHQTKLYGFNVTTNSMAIGVSTKAGGGRIEMGWTVTNVVTNFVQTLVSIRPASMSLISKSPAVTADDCYITFPAGGFVNNSFCMFGNFGTNDASSYIRFPNVDIAQGTTILAAGITLIASSGNSGLGMKVHISAEDSDSSVAPTSHNEFDALVRTTEFVQWNDIPVITDYTVYSTPDLTAVIQEIINRPGWVSGNAIGIILDDDDSSGNTGRYLCTVDYQSASKPVLTIGKAPPPPIEGTLSEGFGVGETFSDNMPVISEGVSLSDTLSDNMAKAQDALSLGDTLAVEVSVYKEENLGLQGIAVAGLNKDGFNDEVTSFSDTLGCDYEKNGIVADEITLSDVVTAIQMTLSYLDTELVPITAVLQGHNIVVVDIPVLTATFEGRTGEAGVMDVYIPALQTTLTGSISRQGILAVNIPPLVSSMTGIAGRISNISVNLPAIAGGLYGTVGSKGILNVTLPWVNGALTGHFDVNGNVLVTLPPIGVRTLTSLRDTFDVMVLNTIASALTHYENYEFNSFFSLNGIIYAVAYDGIYAVGLAEDDAGEPIEAGIETTLIDVEKKDRLQPNIVRPDHVFLGYKTDGDMTMTVVKADGTEYDYPIRGLYDDEHGVRVKIGKGLKGRYVALRFENQGGCDFEIDRIRIFAESLLGIK